MSVIIRNITKSYGVQKALDDVSFTVEKGELVGFLGPNGAGKSTLMKIITGYLMADSGEVVVNDRKMQMNAIELKKDIGYLPEHNPLYTDLYVKEYLEVVAGFYGLRNSKKRVKELVEMVGLEREQRKKIGALSKGYRQRVGLAQALIHNPSVLILDEPTTGLDPNQLEEIRGLIKNISKEKTVIFSSHIMQEVEAICSRVVIINKGKIVADDNINIVKKQDFTNQQVIHVEFAQDVDVEKIRNVKFVQQVHQLSDKNYQVIAAIEDDIRPQLFQFAVDNHLVILTMQRKQENLEKIFRTLTNR